MISFLNRNIATYPSLKNRVVLITGGSNGIGAAMVKHFCYQGSQVVFFDIDRHNAERLIADIDAFGYTPPWFILCDLTQIEQLKEAVIEVEERLGAVKVLINNAAIDDRHEFFDVTPENWDRIMAVNFKHQYFTAQAVAKKMASTGGGSIINLGSKAWMEGGENLSVYNCAKAGISGLTRSLAKKLGTSGIRVNTITPGWTLTERQIRLWKTQEALDATLAKRCLKIEIDPGAIACMALFLASDDSDCCTAQNFVVDAGSL